MKKTLLLYLPLMLALFACKKEDNKIVGSHAPEITYTGVNVITAIQYKDSVIISFSYKDIDGDIGDDSPDIFSLEIKDSRLSKPDYYHIQPLAPLDHTLKIEGKLTAKVNNLFLLGTGMQEYTVLTLRIKDRDSNWSNEIKTPMITILK